MKPILSVRNVTKIYKTYKSSTDRLKELFFKKKYHKEFVSNKDISFDLYEGETLGIIGVNGAGKSTILKQIAGVTDSTSGKIIKRGRVTALLELGTGFNKELTGLQNIYLNGTLIGMSKKECKTNEKDIIDFSELGEYIDEPIKTYSSGMKMRLAFSIAIFSRPKILIVDEALSVGDAHFSAKCKRELTKRKQQNMSIIYVSHDLNSLKILCDRVILLNKGEVVKEGSPQDVINNYNFLISKLNDADGKITISEKNEKSFGTFELEIEDLKLIGKESSSDIVSSGEDVSIQLKIKSKIDADDMTVGIHIQDKFGQNIFGTNTFIHNKKLTFKKDKTYLVEYNMQLNIGTGKYSIGAAIHTKDTHLQNCAHWIDNIYGFKVVGIKGESFVGMCHLYPSIEQRELSAPNAKLPTLFFDMTGIAKNNYGTGISRVVLSQLNALYELESHFEVLPVYLQTKNDKSAHYILDKTILKPSPKDKTISPKKGDIVYSPDLAQKDLDSAVKNKLYETYKKDEVKVAFLVHDLLPIQHPEFFIEGQDAIHKTFIQNISSVSDMLFTTTDVGNKELQEYQTKHHFKTPKIHTLPLGSDLPKSKKHLASHTPSKTTNFLIVSTVEPRKGHKQLLEAFNILWQNPSTKHLTLSIVGKKGWMIQETMNMINNHPLLNKNLFYKGYVTNQELQECYTNADCIIVASEAEGYGLPLIEAAHYNKPIIAREIAVFKEVAQDYPTYFKNTKNPQDIADAIKNFITKPKTKNATLNTITWLQNAEKLKTVLLGMLEMHSSTRVPYESQNLD